MALAFSRTASWAGACAGLILSITLATAATVQSTVMEVDSRGMVTVKTEDDKGHKVKGEEDGCKGRMCEPRRQDGA